MPRPSGQSRSMPATCRFLSPEGLLCVVEDATTLRPVTLHTGNGQVPVSRDKEEVVVNQLLADLLVHASQRVVVSGKVGGEGLNCILHQVLNSLTLVPGAH